MAVVRSTRLPVCIMGSTHGTCTSSVQVCALLEGLLRSALDPDVDPASIMDARLVVRCVGAVLRKHVSLAPDKCAVFLQVCVWWWWCVCLGWWEVRKRIRAGV